MHVAALRDGETVDLNVQKNRVILSVGDDDRVEYDFDTETEAYDAMDEYKAVLSDFLALLLSFKMKHKDSLMHFSEALLVDGD